MDLKDIMLVGRTFDEYERMFALHQKNLLSEKILDAASGVSSFCAEANANGYDVTASDRIYCFESGVVEKKCAADLAVVMDKMPNLTESYQWDFFKNIDHLRANREKAYTGFIRDFAATPERYVYTDYPQSDFADKQFTLTLVSHFLFLYDEHLSYEFHKKTILELIRITSDEIRIFPLVNLRYQKSDFVQMLMADKEFRHCLMSVETVDYEFLKNGNEMMKIKLMKNRGN